MKKTCFAIAILVAATAQAQFPNGMNANKGTNFNGSAVFIGSNGYGSHFHYGNEEDTYIRGGKPTSKVIVGDVGSDILIGNAGNNIYSIGVLKSQNGLVGTKGSSFNGSAVFIGTVHASHFHYATEEDTYIRGGKNTSNVIIGDVGRAVIVGNVPTLPAGYKLYVSEGILTEKVKVAVKTSANWSDYVFDKNYSLMPLQQVESFIQQNHHLPGIPSAKEMVKEGLDLGEMNAKLLAKIEELTLYMIEMKKEITSLQEKVNQSSK